MTFPIASKTRLQIRQEIGYNLSVIMVSSATAGSDTNSLLDTYGMAKGGDDEYNGRQVQINVPSGSIVAGEKSFISDFDSSTKDATMTPGFSTNIVTGDTYEMWNKLTIEQVNNHINQAIIGATDECVQDKETHTTIKQSNKYEYDCLDSFVALHTVEYVDRIGIDHLLDNAEDAWTAGTNVTSTADSSFKKVGTYSSKNVVVSAGATEILCYEPISSVDISDSDKVEFWMYSSIALTAGQLQIKLDDTAAIASALESIDIPAMDASTWYRHSLSLANPQSDTAIISIGIYQVANVADFTFYIDDVHAVFDKSKLYKELNPDFWGIIQASTPLLKLSPVL